MTRRMRSGSPNFGQIPSSRDQFFEVRYLDLDLAGMNCKPNGQRLWLLRGHTWMHRWRAVFYCCNIH